MKSGQCLIPMTINLLKVTIRYRDGATITYNDVNVQTDIMLHASFS